MIIDFHTHTFPENIAEKTLAYLQSFSGTVPYTAGTNKSLLSSAKEAGVDVSVILPVVTKPSQFQTINACAAELQEGALISFGGIHPENENYRTKLRELRDMGIRGIKLHPDYQDTYFNDIRYKRILSYASELGLLVSVHAGVDPKCPENVHCTPEMIAEVLDEVAPENLILAHMGGFMRWDNVEELLIGRKVYLDTAVVFGYISDEQFVRMVRNHSADKILFATDSPWAGQKEFVSHLRALDLTEDEKEHIFHINAEKLLYK